MAAAGMAALRELDLRGREAARLKGLCDTARKGAGGDGGVGCDHGNDAVD